MRARIYLPKFRELRNGLINYEAGKFCFSKYTTLTV